MVVKFNKNLKYSKFYKSFNIKGERNNWRKISSQIILRSCNYSFMKLKELEASRRFLRRYCRKKKGILHIRVIPYQILSYKPLGVRMGKGKGKKVRDYICRIQPGKVLFEFEKNIKKLKIKTRIFIGRVYGIFFLLQKKLSVNTTIFFKDWR